ncbi:hypothetical protein tb265_33980 [Gemmatimonadetes bacterium T265]|nr:hypothetical protein tb265_33980 [Gemmatimonadetes bacterium T265]
MRRAVGRGLMHHHIDLGTVLRGTVCALYSNLVTRPTGAAVRAEIERAIADAAAPGAPGPVVSVIDFSEVTLLDFSCADEIVAKLMLRHVRAALDGAAVDAGADDGADDGVAPTADAYFVFRGVGDGHLDAVEAVLERHAIAIVAVVHGEVRLVGDVPAEERAAWQALHAVAPADAARLAAAAGGEVDRAAAVLARLAARRLVMPAAGGGWLPVGLPARD